MKSGRPPSAVLLDRRADWASTRSGGGEAHGALCQYEIAYQDEGVEHMCAERSVVAVWLRCMILEEQ